MLPSFIIAGGQRCGTTSLYRYLIQHPDVEPASNKEIRFFDYGYPKGLDWYKSHFPLGAKKSRSGLSEKIACDATPDYMIHPLAPARIKHDLPNAKIIFLLRNPVERAFSHYLHHHVTYEVEPLPFEEAIELEADRLEGEVDKLRRVEGYYSYNLQMFSYLYRGRYMEHLQTWTVYFSMEQILILQSEEFYSDPAGSLKRALRFLELPAWELPTFERHNSNLKSHLPADARKKLRTYFAPYNQELYHYLGMDLGWEGQPT